MRRKTHATFSDDRNALNFELPKSWADLSERDLAMVMRCRSRWAEPAVAKLAIFMHLTGLEIRYRWDKVWVCRVPIKEGKKVKKYGFNLDPSLVPGMLEGLDWLDEPGTTPMRLEKLHGVKALPARFHDVDFGTFLQCENCYQGILQSHKPEAVQHLVTLLYPGIKARITEWEQLMVIQWFVQVKTMFALQFPNFYKPAESVGTPSMVEVMNSEIRALTGGDVTKESEILALDTWRALTELDAKAKESEEFNAKYKKK